MYLMVIPATKFTFAAITDQTRGLPDAKCLLPLGTDP
jgi:hypothetical protein